MAPTWEELATAMKGEAHIASAAYFFSIERPFIIYSHISSFQQKFTEINHTFDLGLYSKRRQFWNRNVIAPGELAPNVPKSRQGDSFYRM
jgi:hypothetical protein